MMVRYAHAGVAIFAPLLAMSGSASAFGPKPPPVSPLLWTESMDNPNGYAPQYPDEATIARSTPVTAKSGKLLFFTSGSSIFAVNPIDGSQIWSTEANSDSGQGQYTYGPPEVSEDDNFLYVGHDGQSTTNGTDGITGGVTAVFVGTGAPIWRFPTNGPVYSAPTVAASGRLVYVVAVKSQYNRHGTSFSEMDEVFGEQSETAAAELTVYAISTDAGRAVWNFTVYSTFDAPLCDTPSSLAINEQMNTIYLNTGAGIQALDAATGEFKWYSPNPISQNSSVAATCPTPLISSAAAAGGTRTEHGALIFAGSNIGVRALDSKGNTVWTVDGGIVDQNLAFDTIKSTIFFSSEGGVFAVRPADGEVLWSFDTGYPCSGPAVMAMPRGGTHGAADSLVFVSSTAKDSWETGEVAVWALVNGTKLWNFSLDSDPSGATQASNPVVSKDGKRVFIGSGGTPGVRAFLRALNAGSRYSVYRCQAGDCVGTWSTGTDIKTCQAGCSPSPGLYKCVAGVNGEQQCIGDPHGVPYAACSALCFQSSDIFGIAQWAAVPESLSRRIRGGIATSSATTVTASLVHLCATIVGCVIMSVALL